MPDPKDGQQVSPESGGAGDKPADTSVKSSAPTPLMRRTDPDSVVYGPQERIASGHRNGTVVSSCNLCGKVVRLVRGHILPKWVQRQMTGPPPGGSARGGRVYYYADGLPAEYLFCRECDNYVGIGENYLASLCRGRDRDLTPLGITLKHRVLEGVNRKIVLRGLLGIVLKVHLSISGSFASSKLDERLAERLKQRIRTDSYPDHSYGAMAMKMMRHPNYPVLPRDFPQALINDKGAFFLVGGVLFHLFLRRPHELLDRSYYEASRQALGPDAGSYFLGPGGRWRWIVGGIDQNVTTQSWMGVPLKSDGEDLPWFYDLLTPESDCPCDLEPRLKVNDCCGGDRWMPTIQEAGRRARSSNLL